MVTTGRKPNGASQTADARRPMTVLVTGGAGFIGSHACVELLNRGHEVVVVDNYSNSSPEALAQVAKVAGRPLLAAYNVDIRDRHSLAEAFKQHSIDVVIHFAAMKSIAESVQIPLDYYDNNVGGTAGLLRVMHEHAVHRLVFSSSCSIYGNADTLPIAEDAQPRPTNPYASSKWVCEQIMADACRRHPEFSVLALRYFNPVGAHSSRLLGEAPLGVPNNIMPYLTQVAVGRRERLRVFGDDYDTSDGTAVRDYIHVMDVAEAHSIASERLADSSGMRALNLGTGVGTSVLELIAAFSAACGREIPYEFAPRRPGDVDAAVADPGRIAFEWDWRTSRDLATMCHDAWRFQELNPDGYVAGSTAPTALVPIVGAPK
jgi:UDP-glucose 4-epimerase